MAQQKISEIPTSPENAVQSVVLGVLIGFNAEQKPLVAFANNPKMSALPALSTVPLSHDQVGRSVALVFVEGEVQRPMIIGCIEKPSVSTNTVETLELDKETLLLEAKKNVILKCGDASITLTKAGKVLIKGRYISNHSSGMQTIKGGSVQIN